MTGQLFIRDTGRQVSAQDSRRMLIVAGIIAVADDVQLRSEHQYVVSGEADGSLQLHLDTAVDRIMDAQGQTVTGVLRQPIWRC